MKVFISGIDPVARRNQLAALVQEFYNKNHDKSGRFAPSVGGKRGSSSIGKSVDKIGLLGPSSRFRKRDLKTLSDPQLKKLHAHLETNSRKWGAALTGFAVVAGIAGVGLGMPLLGPVVSNASSAYLTRARERFSVGREAQRRGLHLSFSLIEFQGKEETPEEQLKAYLPDVGKMSPGEVNKALKDGLQAVQDLLSDPEEELTKGERKALDGGRAAIEQVLKKGV